MEGVRCEMEGRQRREGEGGLIVLITGAVHLHNSDCNLVCNSREICHSKV